MATDALPPDQHTADSTAQLEHLRVQVAYLQETLQAIGEGGVDAVILGEPDAEQIYSLASADRPYRVLVESMGEGAMTVSEDGIVLFANQQLASFLGVERTTIVGRDLRDIVDPEHVGALDRVVHASAAGTRRVELPLRGAEGHTVPFLVSATDLDLDGVEVHCLVLTDLTTQKAVEAQHAAEATLAERQRVAQEVNDTIVQGLVVAEMALDLDNVAFARELVARTSAHARAWIGSLAGEGELQPGMAVRQTPASPGGTTSTPDSSPGNDGEETP